MPDIHQNLPPSIRERQAVSSLVAALRATRAKTESAIAERDEEHEYVLTALERNELCGVAVACSRALVAIGAGV